MDLRAPKGMNDVLPGEVGRWQRVERAFREAVERCGYREVRTPLLEPTALFVRSIGEATDIVRKEMYSFDHRGEALTLRPEGTAGAVRAYVEHAVAGRESVCKWYYIGPMFRAERPQKGRLRQFWQAGCEVFGDPGPASDAEMIDMLAALIASLGVPDVAVRVNSIGGPASRARYREALRAHLATRLEALSPESRDRFDRNPLRILDSKDPRDAEAVRDAPPAAAALDEADREHFDGLRRYLDRLGTPWAEEPRLVRGIDYYTRTLFEIIGGAGALGAQNALVGGGRYDDLVRELGGPATPAIGFAMGLERLLLAVEARDEAGPPSVLVAPMGAAATAEALVLARDLRALGVRAEVDGRGASLKSMLRRANGAGAAVCVVLGDSEIAAGEAQIKDLGGHATDRVPLAAAARAIADRIASPRRAVGP